MSAPTTYLITGANKGLGLGLVRYLLDEQPTATIVATARGPSTATELQALRSKVGDRLALVEMDVKDEASVKLAAEKIAALPAIKEDGIGVLVLNAGVSVALLDTATEIKTADLTENLQVNLYGSAFVVRHFLPLVRASVAKRIVYVSSAAGSTGIGFTFARPGDISSYGVSKAAANHYFVRLALELAPEGIHVALYHPGIVESAQSAVLDPSIPKLSPAEAAELWYAQAVIGPVRPAGSFFDEHGETVPW